VFLQHAAEVAEVRARVEAAGLEVEARASEFLVRDRWQTAVVLAVAPAAS